MAEQGTTVLKTICEKLYSDRSRLLDILKEVQGRLGCVSSESMNVIAKALGIQRVEVESVVSFYAFLSTRPQGRVVIRLCNDIVDKHKGAEAVGQVLCEELGISFGQTTSDGNFTLEWAPCIGMTDQAPAVLVNEVVVTRLNGEKVREMVRELKAHHDPSRLVTEFGDGNNADDLVRSMVVNNIRKRGEVIFGEMKAGAGLANALAMSPIEVIRAVKTARLRGTGRGRISRRYEVGIYQSR